MRHPCCLLPGSSEPLEIHEIENGLWAFAETPLDGRTDFDKAALAIIWACAEQSWTCFCRHACHHVAEPASILRARKLSLMPDMACVRLSMHVQGYWASRKCRGHSSPLGAGSTAALQLSLRD